MATIHNNRDSSLLLQYFKQLISANDSALDNFIAAIERLYDIRDSLCKKRMM